MSVEAIHLYRMIIIVFGVERDLKRFYLLIGWGRSDHCLIGIGVHHLIRILCMPGDDIPVILQGTFLCIFTGLDGVGLMIANV